MVKEMGKKMTVLKRKILKSKSGCSQCALLKKANVEICEEAELLRLKNDNLLDQIKGIKENSHKLEEEINMLASQKQALEKRLTFLQEEEEELLNSSGPIQRPSEEGLKTPQAEYEGYKTLNRKLDSVDEEANSRGESQESNVSGMAFKKRRKMKFAINYQYSNFGNINLYSSQFEQKPLLKPSIFNQANIFKELEKSNEKSKQRSVSLPRLPLKRGPEIPVKVSKCALRTE